MACPDGPAQQAHGVRVAVRLAYRVSPERNAQPHTALTCEFSPELLPDIRRVVMSWQPGFAPA